MFRAKTRHSLCGTSQQSTNLDKTQALSAMPQLCQTTSSQILNAGNCFANRTKQLHTHDSNPACKPLLSWVCQKCCDTAKQPALRSLMQATAEPIHKTATNAVGGTVVSRYRYPLH
jgi:hypothetical protein